MHLLKIGKPKTLILSLLIFVSVLQTGCIGLLTSGGSKVVFVPESDGMVRLGGDVKGHVYYYMDGEWVRSKEEVDLPEGWYAGSVDGKVEE
ncbi:MAG: hypothetical protein CMF45_00455 [Legionellales bacterium]|nr:hypothetical protein [Legionellales bacterium]|tara:strand:+ start:24 stop:296 length:273 start_codon:yes stop_codon:yes gene_type:complete